MQAQGVPVSGEEITRGGRRFSFRCPPNMEESMLKKLCPRCGAVMDYGRSKCPACARKRIVRKDEQTKFYHSKEWKQLRAFVLQRDRYLCTCGCGEFAEDVDHAIPIDTPEGWARRLDPDNCRSLTVRCHNRKHGRFSGSTPGGGVGRKSTV